MSTGDEPSDKRDEGIALVAEGSTDDHRLWASGLFDAHWESRSSAEMREGPEGVPVEEALAWARLQSRFVSILTGTGERYSAGTVALEDLTQWPEAGLTFEERPTQTEWFARVQVGGAVDIDLPEPVPAHDLATGQPGRARAETMAVVLAQVPGVSNVAVSRRQVEGWGVDCEVAAPDPAETTQMLHDALSDAGDEVGYQGAIEVSNAASYLEDPDV